MKCMRDTYALIAAGTLATAVNIAMASAGPEEMDRSILDGVPGEDGIKYTPMLTEIANGTTASELAQRGLRLLGPAPMGEYWVCGSDAAWALAVREGLLSPPKSKYERMLSGAQFLRTSGENRTDTRVPYFVRVHEGVLPDRAAAAFAARGVKVLDVARSHPGLVVLATPSDADSFASFAEVRTVAVASPPMQAFDNGARFLLAADGLPSEITTGDLDGSGIGVLVYDTSMPNASHEAFAGRLFAKDGSGDGLHTTAVCGIVAGNGAGSVGAIYRGVAPNAYVVARMPDMGEVHENLCDFVYDYEDAIDNYEVVIANNSLGAHACFFSMSVPQQLRGGYNDMAAAADGFVRGWLGRNPIVLVFAVGNERSLSMGCADYETIMAPSTAKNAISIGSIVGNTLLSATTSGWGPTTDGRLKPELVAPGEQKGAIPGAPQGALDADGTFNETTIPRWDDNRGYVAGFDGTSAAAPQVAGVAALLYQAYRENYGAESVMQPALVKALLIHGARDLDGVGSSYPGPDYHTGYGLVQALESLNLLRSSAWLEGDVNSSDSVEYQLVVPADTDELKLTLVWDDYPGESCFDFVRGDCSSPVLVNDLDLEVVAPSAMMYYGPWYLDPDSPELPAVPNTDTVVTNLTRDRVNNVEQVVIDDPAAGTYTVRIKGYCVPEGPQRFALVATPGLRPCNDSATLSLNRDHVTSASEIIVTLRDCDLDVSGSADTVLVDAETDVSMTTLQITLTETGASTGEFVGVLQLSPVTQAGKLTAANGDEVTVAYSDTSPSMQNVTAVAIVDDIAPTLTLAKIEDAGPTAALLELVTNEPAIVEVEASTLCGEPGRIARGATLGIKNISMDYDHDVVVHELNNGDEYFFVVRATDLAGNTATLSGGCIDLVLPAEIRFAVEAFRESGGAAGTAGPQPFDLEYTSIELRPIEVNAGRFSTKSTVYTVTRTEIEQLPVDPSGGTVIFPFDPHADYDNDYIGHTLADSKLFTLYDLESSESFDTVYIGSNGFITFGAGDTVNAPSLQHFYEFARISAIWTDLDPQRGGTVTYKQLEDRFVVTWMNVPRHLQFDSNTAQIELRFDGTIAISWLEVGITDTIVGVAPSDGTGGGLGAVPTSPMFVPMDLSDAGPALSSTPPSPVSRIARSTTGATLDIVLNATDDNEPYGFLRYKIITLPEVGTLKDGSTAITTMDLPYVLSSFGSTVTFIPPSTDWDGQATFKFIADDTWPESTPPFPSQSTIYDPIPNDGESAPGTILVLAGERRLIRSFLVDDALNTTLWSGFSSGRWEFGQPTGGSPQPNSNDPTGGFTGDNVIGYNLEGDYENSLSAQRLTSPPIDCSAYTDTRLRFRRWLCVQGAPSDIAALEVSANGVDWTPVWVNPASSPGVNAVLLDRGWRLVEYDISSVADGESTVYLRWTMGPTNSSGPLAGWNIDDIIVDGFTDNYCPADVTGDGNVTFADLSAVLANVGIVDQDDPTDINGDGVVDADDIGIVTTSVGMTCP